MKQERDVFEEPRVEFIRLAAEDIITTSNEVEPPEAPDDNWGQWDPRL